MRKLLIARSSTKAERRFHEILKKSHIPFRAKVKVKGREIDFVIGEYAIDIDGHEQDVEKNKMLISEGYNPIHFNNNEIPNPNLVEWLTNIKYGRSITSGDGFRGRTAPDNRKSLGQRNRPNDYGHLSLSYNHRRD